MGVLGPMILDFVVCEGTEYVVVFLYGYKLVRDDFCACREVMMQ